MSRRAARARTGMSVAVFGFAAAGVWVSSEPLEAFMLPTPLVPPPAEVLSLINCVARSVARSRLLAPADVEDFTQAVHLRVAIGDYEILRRFDGQSSLRTYLMVVVARLLMDWQNAAYGKWQPSAAAVRIGPLAVALDRAINRDGSDVDQAVRTVSRRTGLTEAEVRQVADRVPRPARRRRITLEFAESASLEFADPIVERDQRLRAAAPSALYRWYERVWCRLRFDSLGVFVSSAR